MKRFFASPVVAWVLLAVVVIGSTVVNTRIRLGREAESVREAFYTLRDEASSGDSLLRFCTAAEELVLLSERVGVDSNIDTEDLAELQTELRRHSLDVDDLFDDYDDLLKDVFSLEQRLAREDLSESDQSVFLSAQRACSEAKAALDESSYNDLVRSFLKRYQRFPTPLIATLSGVAFPQLFA